jgi:antitoxin HigA-1
MTTPRKGATSGDIRDLSRVATHPGVMLRAEFLEPLGLSARALAKELGIPANRLTEIIAGRRGLSAETALLLSDRFGTTAEFWLNLQMLHDLNKAIVARKSAAKPVRWPTAKSKAA